MWRRRDAGSGYEYTIRPHQVQRIEEPEEETRNLEKKLMAEGI